MIGTQSSPARCERIAASAASTAMGACVERRRKYFVQKVDLKGASAVAVRRGASATSSRPGSRPVGPAHSTRARPATALQHLESTTGRRTAGPRMQRTQLRTIFVHDGDAGLSHEPAKSQHSARTRAATRTGVECASSHQVAAHRLREGFVHPKGWRCARLTSDYEGRSHRTTKSSAATTTRRARAKLSCYVAIWASSTTEGVA